MAWAMGELEPAIDDLAAREPAWLALSEMFLDTDVTLSRRWRAQALAASGYSVAQLERILVEEVSPACRINLWCVAGVWDGFDPAWLRERILRRRASPWRVLGRLRHGWLDAGVAAEWRATVQEMVRLRAE